MARNNAFTLVEFLTGTAVVALLGVVIAPITAQARQAAGTATTATSLQRIGMAANQYANDYDGNVVLTQQNAAAVDKPWSVLLQPYLPGQAAYFDPSRSIPSTLNVAVGLVQQPWYRMTNLSINDGGYSGRWATLGNTAAGKMLGYTYGVRKIDSTNPNTGVKNIGTMLDQGSRVAFAPTSYGTTGLGYSYFRAFDAGYIQPSILPSVFSWNNMVWNTNTLYADKKIPVVHADGSAGFITRADFQDTTQQKTAAYYNKWMSTDGKKVWGSFWDGL